MKITQLNHVALHVVDLDASVAFYEEVLRLEKMVRPAFGFPGAWFRMGRTGEHQELHLISRELKDPAPPRERHFAFMVDDIHTWANHLRDAGVDYTGPKPRPDGALQIFLRDPDEHVIELCTPAIT